MPNANNISELDSTAANNSALAGTSILGTGLVSTADDSFRNLGSFLAKQWSDLGAVNTVGGTANAITITTPTVYGALKTGMFFYFTAALFNTSAVTINLDSLGAKAGRVASDGTDIALIPGDLRAKGRYLAIYDATANSAAGAWIIFNAESAGRYPPGTLYGLTLSNNVSDATNDIDIAVGSARDGADSANIDQLSAIGKQLDVAWAVGGTPGATLGGLDTGSVGNNTYYIWKIKRPDTGVDDVLFSLSSTAPTMPTNYTIKRIIGEVTRAGGVNGVPVSYQHPIFKTPGLAPAFAIRAWVNFNGTGTVAIRASGNVSSITDNGVGNYTVNFTIAMPDANYAVSGQVSTDVPSALMENNATAAGSTTVTAKNGENNASFDPNNALVMVVR